jgi:hypothetical protein
MTYQDLIDSFERNEDEFLKFERIDPAKLHTSRADLQALIYLDKMMPSDEDIISDSSHDVIYLSYAVNRVASLFDEVDVIMLLRCGVCLDKTTDSFYLFT